MSKFNALIIDDNAMDAAILRSLLDRVDVAYEVLPDSRQVAEYLGHVPRPDIIFLDLEMPGLDGYMVLEAIQAHPDFATVPVVAYTANSAEMPNARAAGFHSFLGKPLRGSVFQEQLERILNDDPVWEVRES